jgi:hypothetical protein
LARLHDDLRVLLHQLGNHLVLLGRLLVEGGDRSVLGLLGYLRGFRDIEFSFTCYATLAQENSGSIKSKAPSCCHLYPIV